MFTRVRNYWSILMGNIPSDFIPRDLVYLTNDSYTEEPVTVTQCLDFVVEVKTKDGELVRADPNQLVKARR